MAHSLVVSVNPPIMPKEMPEDISRKSIVLNNRLNLVTFVAKSLPMLDPEVTISGTSMVCLSNTLKISRQLFKTFKLAIALAVQNLLHFLPPPPLFAYPSPNLAKS